MRGFFMLKCKVLCLTKIKKNSLYCFPFYETAVRHHGKKLIHEKHWKQNALSKINKICCSVIASIIENGSYLQTKQGE